MAKLAADRSSQIKIKEMALAKNGFDVAAEQIKDEQIAEETEGAVMEKDGGDKLPGVSVVHAAIAEGEIFADKTRLIAFEEKLRDEGGRIRGNQREQNNPVGLSPRASKRR